MIENQLSLHAKLDVNFSGKSVEDFNGKMNLTEIAINNQGEKFNTDSLEIKATRKNSTERKLTIQSSFLTGQVKGDYDFNELPDLILAYINDYYPLDNFLSKEQKMVEFKDIIKPQIFDLNFGLTNRLRFVDSQILVFSGHSLQQPKLVLF